MKQIYRHKYTDELEGLEAKAMGQRTTSLLCRDPGEDLKTPGSEFTRSNLVKNEILLR